MTITADRKTEVIKEYQRDDKDSGSPEIQVAIMTERIKNLTGHMRTHSHDYASRRGLLQLVSKRNRLLRYLSRTNRPAYLDLIQKLGLRK